MQTKVERRMESISELGILQCPKCRGKLSVEGRSLKCQSGHTYDFSKKGTVNFVLGYGEENYSKDMLEARRKLMRLGLFEGILDRIADAVAESGISKPVILDAGCGEGTGLEYLDEKLKEKGIEARLLGIDISSGGITIAGRTEKDILFFVADLGSLPFSEQSLDFVINMFTPASYREFRRVLKPGGKVLKVVPEREHLIELREAYGLKEYSNDEIVAHMAENMSVVSRERISTTFDAEGHGDELLLMTPMLWGKTEGKSALAPKSVTVSASLFILE
ncbi:methyltransferase domain-containing protein [Youngiibacter multivorans]|uniref:SAM-dependent methyltransferase n=1 Tax=Youngiibacter multivorans TaxID=937251 RepID=A0ABS4G1B7_9CLOT|nr:methyltransferase domain-containing protein [Youngiibacter multivorans]MBP1918342.1 SAM-dependent methyltransferase [Youngiibacter multivorans]